MATNASWGVWFCPIARCWRGYSANSNCSEVQNRSDASENRFLKACDVTYALPETLARRAALLRRRAKRGSAVDAPVVAHAEPAGTVLTSDPHDLAALAAHAESVDVMRV
jgi:hypothetical protein